MSMREASPRSALNSIVLRSLMRDVLPESLPGWLTERRWYGDKGRHIDGVELVDCHVEPVGQDWLALTVARLTFAEGEDALYFLPLALTDAAGDAQPLTLVAAPATHALVDATTTAWFGHWLLDQLARGTRFDERWSFSAPAGAASRIASTLASPPALMGGEQSNTSLRFAEALTLKIIRRLQPGPNPEEEVLRGLSRLAFGGVPAFVGSAAWRDAAGVAYPVALAQAFVPNVGDGWSWLQRRLAEIAAGRIDLDGETYAAEQVLGERTAELHRALSLLDGEALAPERVDDESIRANQERTSLALADAVALLREREAMLPASIRSRFPAALAGIELLAERVAGYGDERGTWRIRVHGDYHLGQTLRTISGDWTVIDFEGEPARSVVERRQKLSALKDVAGMLRSFAYARGVAEKSEDVTTPGARERLAIWEREARNAFLEGYRTALVSSPLPLAPADDASFARALAAWELDKALYEIAYEARNRPDWIAIPLRGLLPTLNAERSSPTLEPMGR
jgi:maltose alpha-D-glucosyltransferase/alpha-amylase